MDFGAAMFFPDHAMVPGAFVRALAVRGVVSLWSAGPTR
jgi:hypothetical protein